MVVGVSVGDGDGVGVRVAVGDGVGAGVAVGAALGAAVAVGAAVITAVAVAVSVGVADGVGVAPGVGVAVAVGVGVGVPRGGGAKVGGEGVGLGVGPVCSSAGPAVIIAEKVTRSPGSKPGPKPRLRKYFRPPCGWKRKTRVSPLNRESKLWLPSSDTQALTLESMPVSTSSATSSCGNASMHW